MLVYCFGILVLGYVFCLAVIWAGPKRVERIVTWRQRRKAGLPR